MKVYKFKDAVDGKFAFIIAKSHEAAGNELVKLTSIPFKLVDTKAIEELKRPIVLRNDILPF